MRREHFGSLFLFFKKANRLFVPRNPLAVEAWWFVRVPRWMMFPDNKFGAVALR